MSKLSKLSNSVRVLTLVIMGSFLQICPDLVWAVNKVVLGSKPKSVGFLKIYAFLDDLTKFMTGPIAIVVSLVSIVAVIALWMLAPKAQGVMAWAMRVAIGIIIIFNATTWVATLQV